MVSLAFACAPVTSVVAGGGGPCAIANGQLKKNDEGQTGNGKADSMIGDEPGEMGPALRAVPLGPGRSVLGVARAWWTTCALVSMGTRLKARKSISCWGLGFGTTPVDIDPGKDFIPDAIVSGSYHFCALSTGGVVKCFGENKVGQLGRGDAFTGASDNPAGFGVLPQEATPVDLGPSARALSIWSTRDTSCAVLFPGNVVKCWGDNSAPWRRLGDSSLGDIVGDEPGEMGAALPSVQFGPTTQVKSVAVMSWGACALVTPPVDSVSLWCWGTPGAMPYWQVDQKRPELVTSLTHGRVLGPALLETAIPIMDITSGGDSTCALTAGRVTCIGSDIAGDEQPDYAMPLASRFVLVGSGQTAEAVSCSTSNYCCALLLPSATVKCWGNNDMGELGQGDITPRGSLAGSMGDALPSVPLAPWADAGQSVPDAPASPAPFNANGIPSVPPKAPLAAAGAGPTGPGKKQQGPDPNSGIPLK
ncbi:hypothetical protein HYH03_012032 [Edaphochlamys debaryana]|uniref:Uncharacterized protein n=1 Tax=Edaphochlamys debaryana TaxID=47281 RepID=A0A835XTH2_9CHLO|nr:hypothetical protein HYH03_012032 [Edaphochlamys debaryana]|eukprot:KAG2489390.1 hypothetical protein HYH03_012032 [Edaphochlamys debaryana]